MGMLLGILGGLLITARVSACVQDQRRSDSEETDQD